MLRHGWPTGCSPSLRSSHAPFDTKWVSSPHLLDPSLYTLKQESPVLCHPTVVVPSRFLPVVDLSLGLTRSGCDQLSGRWCHHPHAETWYLLATTAPQRPPEGAGPGHVCSLQCYRCLLGLAPHRGPPKATMLSGALAAHCSLHGGGVLQGPHGEIAGVRHVEDFELLQLQILAKNIQTTQVAQAGHFPLLPLRLQSCNMSSSKPSGPHWS